MSETNSTPVKKGDLTPREIEVLAKAWQCMDSEPKVDLEKLASLTGYTNPRSCANTMASIRKKLAALAQTSEASSNDDVVTPSASKKASAKKTTANSARKRKTDSEDELIADAENGASPSPCKKRVNGGGRKKKSEALVSKETLNEDVGNGEGIDDAAVNDGDV